MVQSLVRRHQGAGAERERGQEPGADRLEPWPPRPRPRGRFPAVLTPPPAGLPPPRPGATPGPYPQPRQPHFPAD